MKTEQIFKWSGALFILIGITATGTKLASFFTTPTAVSTISRIEDVDGKCRRKSGRKEACMLQKLTLTYSLPNSEEQKGNGSITPEIQTQFKVGDSLQGNFYQK